MLGMNNSLVWSGGPEKGRWGLWCNLIKCLASESVQCSALSLQSIDNIHGCDSLPLGVLSVGDGISDHVLKENLQNTSGLLIDQSRDSLHTTSSCQTSDGRLGDSLDVISQHFPVPLGSSFSKSLSSFASSRHDNIAVEQWMMCGSYTDLNFY